MIDFAAILEKIVGERKDIPRPPGPDDWALIQARQIREQVRKETKVVAVVKMF